VAARETDTAKSESDCVSAYCSSPQRSLHASPELLPASRRPRRILRSSGPIIDVTDLYHPHQDVGDNFDIIAAMPFPRWIYGR